MTTVVYRNDHIASDSLTTAGGVTLGTTPKCGVVTADTVVDVRSGAITVERWLWGAAGSAVYAHAFAKWVANGAKGVPPTARALDHSFDRGILIRKPGVVEVYEDGGMFVLETEIYAMGSGKEFALGALAAGATVKHAIEIACQYDVDSNGPVKVYTLYDE